MPTATQGSSEHQINQINLWMRQQPWYQEWFASKGLNPNQVKLNEAQRAELARLAAQHGVQLGARMKIDEAGNVNQQGGWAGMHPLAKIGIGAAAGLGAGSALGALAGGSGVGASGLGPGMNAATQGAAYHAGSPLLMGAGGFLPTGAAAGGGGALASRAIGSGMGTDPSLAGMGSRNAQSLQALAAGGSGAAGLAGSAGRSLTDRLLGAGVAGLAGLPGILNQGPSDEERRYLAQIEGLLKQQQQRQAFQNPLYEAVTKMAFNLMPGTGGSPYPYGSLKDVE